MHAKVNTSIKSLILILGICVILVSSGISIWYFVPEMTTDISVSGHYSYEIGSPTLLSYEYQALTDAKGNSLLNDGDCDIWYINRNFAIATYKNDRMHYDMLRRHIADQLVYFNDQTQTAEVLYECTGTNRIVYGNMDFVLIYNAEQNVFQYISLVDGKIMQEMEANLKTKRAKYCFTLDKNLEYVAIERIKAWGENELVTALPLALQ